MNLAEFEDWKWVIFSPEVGSPRDLFAELLWVKLRKPFLKYDKRKDSKDAEVKAAIKFVKEHFYIIDPVHADLNEHIYFKTIKDIQEKYKVKINGTVIDPVTDFEISGQQRDLALGRFLTRVRKFSSSYGIHSVLAFHTKSMGYTEGETVDGTKIRYLPPATMFDVAGGEMASRKGMFILSLWRTPYNVVDKETGVVYPPNETRVNILKAKPKSIGKIGTIKLYYDALSSRYYELDGDTKCYSQPQNKDAV
jgi:ribosomal protein L31E